MTWRSRLARLRSSLTAATPDRRFWSVTLIRAGHDPEGRPPGMYGSSLHLDIVYDGPEPPPVPRERLAPHALVVECGPTVVPPPPVEAGER